MKRIISFMFVLIISGFIFSSAEAQSKDTANNSITWGVAGVVNVTQVNLSGLNESLSQNGLAPLNANLIVPILLSLYIGPQKTSVPLSYHISFGAGQETQQNASYASKLIMSIWNATLQYSIWHTKRSMLSPGLGFGFMGYNLHLYSVSKTSTSFEDALNNMQGERHLLASNNYYLNPSISYHWAVDSQQDLLIGVHAGYRIGLNKKYWQLESGAALSGSPSTTANGFYAGVDIFVQ